VPGPALVENSAVASGDIITGYGVNRFLGDTAAALEGAVAPALIDMVLLVAGRR